jgi:hypothetical protein
MKTIKIYPKVHVELKTFCAIKEENMEVYASQAILKRLKEDGHKFVFGGEPKKQKLKTSNTKTK